MSVWCIHDDYGSLTASYEVEECKVEEYLEKDNCMCSSHIVYTCSISLVVHKATIWFLMLEDV